MAVGQWHRSKPVAVVLLLAACILCAATRVSSHSALIDPLNRDWDESCRIGGRPPFWKNCHGPCSRQPLRHYYHVKEFRRSQNIPVVYYKNNHKDGFLRLTLVPLKHKFNKWVHARNAFRWSCWSFGTEPCPNRSHQQCGNDGTGRRYRQWVTIPPVFPDGVYVLGFVWYGGYPKQATYWSCAEIRIKGGPMQNNYTPVFTNHHNGQCKGHANGEEQCVKEPCFNRPEKTWKPIEFMNGHTPKPINRWTVNN